MNSLQKQLESLLFVCESALSTARLMKTLSASKKDVEDALRAIEEKWNTDTSGVMLVRNGDDVQLLSHPDNAEVVAAFLKDETTGELTRPALETLSIIAYRQPISKPELEQIRGVNCSLILRNLLMRGLVQEKEDTARMQAVYRVTMDFVRLLGISSIEQLPDYASLRAHAYVEDVVSSLHSEEKLT